MINVLLLGCCLASYLVNTRAGLAIKAGGKIRRISGIPTVEIEAPKIFAEGQCCGIPYTTEYISSAGASVHVWLRSAADVEKMEKVIEALIYWKDLLVLTWSLGEPFGYKTNCRLGERYAGQKAVIAQAQLEASIY